MNSTQKFLSASVKEGFHSSQHSILFLWCKRVRIGILDLIRFFKSLFCYLIWFKDKDINACNQINALLSIFI